jgi:sugar O-acyltransferase (sialic acid O-acetyltransferase NeuD family)
MPKKMRPIIIFAAGGHAVSIANIAISAGFDIAYFVDNLKKETTLLGIKVIAEISNLPSLNDFEFSIAISDNFTRQIIYNEILKLNLNLRFPTLIHQSAIISHFSTIGEGTVVMPKAIVGPNSSVGKFCILNTQSSIDHDCVMSDFSSLAPNAVTGGNVKIGTRSAISIGAVVRNDVAIGDDSIIGANSYLQNDLANNCVAYGTPAKIIRKRANSDSYLR